MKDIKLQPPTLAQLQSLRTRFANRKDKRSEAMVARLDARIKATPAPQPSPAVTTGKVK